MWPFTSQAVPVEAPAETPEQQLAAVSREYREAENEFTKACQAVTRYNARYKDNRMHKLNNDWFARLNAMTRDPVRQGLEAAREQARGRRNELLRARSELLAALGKIR